MAIAQVQLDWDYPYSTDTRYKQSAMTLERGVDGNIIFTYQGGTVYFGVYTDMLATPNTNKIYQGMLINTGASGNAQLVENGATVPSTTFTVGTNIAVRMERKGARLIVSVGTTATGGTWTTVYQRYSDPNKDWHPFMYDQSSLHTAHRPLVSFSTNKEGFLPDYSGLGVNLTSLTSAFFPAYDSLTFKDSWNWIYTRTYNGEGHQPCHELSQSISYVDGLGRQVQQQTKDYTNDKVWITQTIFDRYGRPAINTLPAPKNNSKQIGYVSNFVLNGSGTAYAASNFDANGKYFSPDPVGNTAGTLGAWYYNTDGTDDPGRPATQYPFTQTEVSSLSGGARYTTLPGEAFKMGSGKYGARFDMMAGSELEYLFGKRHPLAIVAGSSVYDPSNTLAQYSTMAIAARYMKQVLLDADGKESVVFMDMEGREVARCLAGKVNSANVNTQATSVIIPPGEYRDIHITDQGSPNTTVNIAGGVIYEIYDLKTYNDFNTTAVASGLAASQSLAKGLYRVMNRSNAVACTLSYVLNYHNFTLNIYDLSGKQVAQVPPLAIQGLGNSANPPAPPATPPAHTQGQFSWYRYNGLGQLLWSQTPDAGKTEYYYRKDGQVRYSQNALQKAANKFSYTNYSANGRVEESGEYFLSGITPATLQGHVDLASPPTGSTKLTNIITKYDEPYQTPPGRTQRNTMGRVSYVEKREGSSTTVSKTWYSYNTLGQTEWVAEYVDANIGTKATEYSYDLLGKVTEIAHQPSASGEFRHVTAYNNEGRLESVSTRLNSQATTLPEIAVQYSYYKTGGGVKGVKYHDNFREQLYSYTLQGQLKAINYADINALSTATGNQLFSMSLDYYPTDFRTNMGVAAPEDPTEATTSTTWSYSGLIARQRWKTRATVGTNFSGVFAYTYKYNHRNEFTDGQFATAGNSTGVGPYHLPYSNINRELISTYDLNGNIKSMSRWSAAGGATPQEAYTYKYKYERTTPIRNNQLDFIQGTFNTTAGYLKSQTINVENYVFDAIGQLTEDKAENLKMEYDVYGKVIKVRDRTTNALKAEFTYNADGMRVKKVGYSGTTTTYSYYVYAQDMLMSIYQEVFTNGSSPGVSQKEVMVYAGSTRIGTAYVAATYYYRYELKDHLGNVRCVFGRGTGGGYNTLNTDYYADYYPYGWVLPGRNGSSGSGSRFGFQGEHAERDPETGWNAFELRQYDSRVGRWMSIDPMLEFHSPYLAFGNNPTYFKDPNGGSVDGIGVNSLGEVLYDDGKNDGNFYFLGGYNGEKITNMADLKTLVPDFQTFISAGTWIASHDDVLTLFCAIAYKEGVELDVPGRKLLVDASASMATFQAIGTLARKKIEGSSNYTYRISELKITYSRNKGKYPDAYYVYSAIAHELQHVRQYNEALPAGGAEKPTSFFGEFNSLSKANQDEHEAYNYQKNHWTFPYLTSKKQQHILNRIENTRPQK